MAVLTQAQLIAKINLYITTNGNKEITGAQLNEILQDMVDSGFLILDDPRTAVSTSYTADNVNDWLPDVAPVEVKNALDILIKRVSSSPSQNIAYVSNTGSDVVGEFEIGNPLKPFASITAAWNALPSNNVILKVLGGSYTEELDLGAKTNFAIDISGTNITATGLGFRLLGSQNGFVYNRGGTITGNCNFAGAGAQKVGITGGTINGTLNLGEKAFNSDLEISSASFTIQSEVTNNDDRPYLTNCIITGTASNFVTILANVVCSNCDIRGTWAVAGAQNTSAYPEFNNCKISGNGVASARTVIGSTNGIVNAIFRKCRIEGFNECPIRVGGGNNSSLLLFDDCEVISPKECVNFSSIVRDLTARTTFDQCKFLLRDSVTYDVFTGTTGGGDLGKTQVINATTNKALPLGLTNFEELGNTTVITDLQIF